MSGPLPFLYSPHARNGLHFFWNDWKKIKTQIIFCDMWKLYEIQIKFIHELNFIGTEPCLFIYILFMGVFCTQVAEFRSFRRYLIAFKSLRYLLCSPLQKKFTDSCFKIRIGCSPQRYSWGTLNTHIDTWQKFRLWKICILYSKQLFSYATRVKLWFPDFPNICITLPLDLILLFG